jgi:predicted permease
MRDSTLHNFRYALRRLARTPLFSVLAVLSLALGIGSATAIFSVVNSVLLTPLGYEQADRLMLVREVLPPLVSLYPSLPVNLRHFRFWKAQVHSMTSMAAFKTSEVTLTAGSGEPEILDMAETTCDIFMVLGTRPSTGRSFFADEELPGRNRVVVVTDSLWRRRFGASPRLAGSVILLDGVPHTVIGVLPPEFRFPRRGDLGSLANLGERTDIFRPVGEFYGGWTGSYDYNVFARLKPGASPAQARTELDLLETQISQEHKVAKGLRVEIRPLLEAIVAPVRTGLLTLLAAVGLLLVIVCANLVNLILVRASGRVREFSIQAALGASRIQLVHQILAEALVLSIAGGLLGMVVASAGLRIFVAIAPVVIPRLDEVRLNVDVALFTLALTVTSALFSGVPPALRMAAKDLLSTFRVASDKLTEHRRTLRLRELFVGSEVAVSTMLLILAGLLMGSLYNLLQIEKGLRTQRVIAVALRIPSVQYPSSRERSSFFDRVLERVATVPGVLSAAFISKLPVTGESEVNSVQLEGSDQEVLDPASRELVTINVRFISPNYFRSLGIQILRGRDIQPGDRNRDVAVVSARMAAKLWLGRDPVGKKLRSGSHVGEVVVVGVAADIHNAHFEQDPTPVAYVPLWKYTPMSGEVVLRTAIDPSMIVPTVANRIWSIDPAIAVPQSRTMAEVVADAYAQPRFQVQLATGFALCALLLAALGIYGVVSYSVAGRRAEIGLRIALGARMVDVVALVVTEGLRPVIGGLAVGTITSVACVHLIRSLLFRTTTAEPAIIAAVAVVVTGVGSLACLVPGLVAARLDPARVLHEE